MERGTVESILAEFRSLKILVLGDFMLDQWVWGSVYRISPEAPVPVVDIERETFSLGGAGNVAVNIRSLGAGVIPLGVVGQDWMGERMLKLMSDQAIPTRGLWRSSRGSTLKTRVIAHQQQVVRVDREDRTDLESGLESVLSDQFVRLLDTVDGIVISDYSKGAITPSFLKRILPEARNRKKLVCLDPKPRHFSSYTPVTVLTPNLSEAAGLLGYPISNESDLQEAGKRILDLIECQALLITRGEKGMALFSEGKMTLVPTRAREVYDVTGAGDTVISVLCLALAAGTPILESVQLANLAAGIVVGKVGTATVKPDELIAAI